jgi:type IV pilus secretin PilQ/predicted competence protein
LVHPYLRANMKKNNKRLIFFLGGILFFFFGLGENPFSLWAKAVQTPPTARLLQIEDQALEDRIRVTLITDQPVVYRSFSMTDPPRLVLDLKPCVLDPEKAFTLKDPSIAGVRYSQFNSKTVRIVFDFSQPPVFQVSHKKGNPFQIFVDLPTVKPQMTQPVSKKIEEKYLAQTTIEEFKKEKAFQDIRLKEEKAHSQKPLVTFDFYMTNLHNVLRLIGEIGGVNILVGDEVKEKKLTLSLKEVPWDEAMNSILDANNLKKLLRGEKTILVTTHENYKKITDDENKVKLDAIKIEQEELKAEEQRQKVGKITWEKRQFQIKNVDVKLVEDLIQGSIEKEKKIASNKDPGIQQTIVTETFKVSGANVHIMSVPHTNTLIARGTERELNYIEELIKTIDQPVSQVMIEARIVEADASFTRDMGIRWGGGASFANTHAPFAGTVRGGDAGATTNNPTNNYAVNLPFTTATAAFGGLGFSFASTNFNIDVRIQAMEQQGRGKTISSPKVLTLDNKEAIIKQGQSIPVTTRDQNNTFSTVYRDAALVLKVTPHISSGKKIRITVKVEKNEPDFTRVDTLGNPTINTKEAETEMMVNDGDTVAIGGILYKKETFVEDKVPGLGEIPILGWLFKTRYRNTDDKEMLIFLTPKIQKSSLPDRFGNDS